jgi:hypothetical protein
LERYTGRKRRRGEVFNAWVAWKREILIYGD